MLSGMYPESTRIVNHWTKIDPPAEVSMMAEFFARAGYQTAAVDNLFDGWVPSGYREYPWFRRGYDHYEYPRKPGFYQPSEDCVGLACDWLEQKGGQPFLLFLHVWNPHAPYNKAPESFYRFYGGADPCDPDLDAMPAYARKRCENMFGMPVTDPKYVEAAYDAEIAYTDHSLGILFEKLDALGLTEDTVILITSDHGEIMTQPRTALGWPWYFCHIGLHEDCLRVPLIIAGGPVREGARVTGLAQLVDIVPTLAEMFDLAEASNLDGVSLMPALASEAATGRDAAFVSENTYQKQRGVVKPPWKYLRLEQDYQAMPRRCLFHLEEDPLETANLIEACPEQGKEMEALLDAYVERTSGPSGDPLKEQDVGQECKPPFAV